MDFDYQRVKEEELAVLGFMGSGEVNKSSDWTADLWFKLDESLEKIATYLVTDADEFTYWGVMSDAHEWLAPWEEEGLYLAGVEVPLSFEERPPFTKWVLPAMEYIVVKTLLTDVEGAVSFVFEEVLDKEEVEVTGAIQERYPTSSLPGEISLYFPIAMNDKEEKND